MTTKHKLAIIVVLLINVLFSIKSNATGKVTIMSSDVSVLESLSRNLQNIGYDFELFGPDEIESKSGKLHYCKSEHPEDVYDRYPADFVLFKNGVDDTVASALKALNPGVNILVGRQVKKFLRVAKRGRKALEKYFSAFENGNSWNLLWSDEFDYSSRDELLKVWESSAQPFTHILSSRWPENVEVTGSTVRLVNHKERRGGQDWTSASINTREDFQYGYFECRYKYAATTGTNNSFWLMTRIGAPAMPLPGAKEPEKGKRFEIDVNEGHYPNKVNCTLHNWSDQPHQSQHKKKVYDGADYSQEFHIFGLEWTETDIVYFVDGKEVMRCKNEFCYSPASILLSMAIIPWAGKVTDAIDGSFMEVDYVRVYKERKLSK